MSNTPSLLLWFFALAYGVAAGVTESGELTKRADMASSIALPLLVALWVVRDAAMRGRKIWYDFDSFLFFAWPFILPVYLFQTRGMRAIWTIVWFGALWAFAWGVAVAVSMLALR